MLHRRGQPLRFFLPSIPWPRGLLAPPLIAGSVLTVEGPRRMRKLAFHEQKLLRRTNFLIYPEDKGHREGRVTRRYHIVERDDYKK